MVASVSKISALARLMPAQERDPLPKATRYFSSDLSGVRGVEGELLEWVSQR